LGVGRFSRCQPERLSPSGWSGPVPHPLQCMESCRCRAAFIASATPHMLCAMRRPIALAAYIAQRLRWSSEKPL
jgi:hypothetical protein